jgi:glc operon protein GlcG
MIKHYFFSSIVFIGAVLTAAVASAQLATFERKIITSSAARQVVDGCIATAADYPVPIAIAVVDPFGVLVEFHAMQGANETTGTTALLKAKTAARWRRSSASVNQMVTSGTNQAPVWIGDFPQPGGVPILIDGLVVGAGGVGGLPRAPHLHGEACAIAAIEAVFGPGTTPPPMTLQPQ